MADALEAKIGKGRTRRLRRKTKMALPEPPAARTRRVWGIQLDWAFEKTYWLYLTAYVLFFVPTALLLLMMPAALFGLDRSHALEDQILQLFIYKYVMLAVVSCFVILIALAPRWLRTTRGERLGPSLAFISVVAP